MVLSNFWDVTNACLKCLKSLQPNFESDFQYLATVKENKKNPQLLAGNYPVSQTESQKT